MPLWMRTGSGIEDRLLELQGEFQHQRQTAIAEELLDIVAGSEALNPEGENSPEQRLQEVTEVSSTRSLSDRGD